MDPISGGISRQAQAGFPPVNAPPIVFGPVKLSGSPQMSPPSFSPRNLPAGLDPQETTEAKRRRIAKACDMCRKKKIKCDGAIPSCSHCVTHKTECKFTQVEKKRNPPKGAKYIEGLENRIGRLESLLELKELLIEVQNDEAPDLITLEKTLIEKIRKLAGGNSSMGGSQRSLSVALNSPDSIHHLKLQDTDNATSPAGPTSPRPTSQSGEAVESLADKMETVIINNSGETRYIGSSSGFSIFSYHGMNWVLEKSGETTFKIPAKQPEAEERLDIGTESVDRPLYENLPPLEETLSLLKDFFQHFNCMFPLFHEGTFMKRIHKLYSDSKLYQIPAGVWAALNVALAISHRLRVISKSVSPDEDKKAWKYMNNAKGVLDKLVLYNTDLLTIQALLGMAVFLQGTSNPQPTYSLVAAAIRISHCIGLHKRASNPEMTEEVKLQRQRVFWIGYMVDKDICLQSGRPPAQNDDDMNVELPEEDPSDNIGNVPSTNEGEKMNLFRVMAKFALIQSRVYSQLYSTKAAKKSAGEILNIIGELDRELEEWKDAIPIDFRPDHEINVLHAPLKLHLVMLHFGYYNCLSTIHRMSVHHGYWTCRLSDFANRGLNSRPLNPRVFSSGRICVTSARSSIQLMKELPLGDNACVWLVLYFPVTSLVTLFAHILQEPKEATTPSDLALMQEVLKLLEILAADSDNGGVVTTLQFCQEFERIAKLVIKHKGPKPRSQGNQKRKRDDTIQKQETGRTFGAQVAFTSQMSGPAPVPEPSQMEFKFESPQNSNIFNQPMPSYVPNNLSTMPWHQQGDLNSVFNSQTFMAPALDHQDLSQFPNMPNLDFGADFPPGFAQQENLWQMPMSTGWEWTEITTGQMIPSFDSDGNLVLLDGSSR
ncbi:MAG: hypothetical protein M1829_001033 [Trizodia sp. TS-e1964]|nr:MAG: hypothetical protein M1829_001033 [Trizodia sp. TS-e1964]